MAQLLQQPVSRFVSVRLLRLLWRQADRLIRKLLLHLPEPHEERGVPLLQCHGEPCAAGLPVVPLDNLHLLLPRCAVCLPHRLVALQPTLMLCCQALAIALASAEDCCLIRATPLLDCLPRSFQGCLPRAREFRGQQLRHGGSGGCIRVGLRVRLPKHRRDAAHITPQRVLDIQRESAGWGCRGTGHRAALRLSGVPVALAWR
mmetsp:Transcript_124530/g.346707  ORF Transcript_124530/g.346707 Transcript_124530/m.346707 type:complete len:203 (-) Transcript_124530:52-660(-)